MNFIWTPVLRDISAISVVSKGQVALFQEKNHDARLGKCFTDTRHNLTVEVARLFYTLNCVTEVRRQFAKTPDSKAKAGRSGENLSVMRESTPQLH
ncbi:hypothetical protein MWU63_03535 [Pseudohalocynthiibacter sp. F2068]|jgi:hypothetical protein|nr:hypothetical protein [Pseudohalocynthiibacter sp. F2068]